MQVEIVEDSINVDRERSSYRCPAESGTAFLKLFDWRHARQLRHDKGREPWSKAIEEIFLNEKTMDYFHKLAYDPEFDDTAEYHPDTDEIEEEALVWTEMLLSHKNEVATYSRLKHHQGNRIPHLLAEVAFDACPSDSTDAVRKKFQIKGILLQYLPGFTLSSIMEHTPPSSWQYIIDQAIKVVHVLSDNDILNADVRPDNFMVVPKEDTEGGYQVFMIDFGQCRFRKDETDSEWGRMKWTQDEEGAVGVVMKSRLRKEAGFQIQCQPSERYLEWAPGEGE